MAVAYLYHDQLQTNRLTTRFLTPEDILPWAQFFKDKEALEFLSTFGFDSCENMSKHWIERQLLRYNENNLGCRRLLIKQPVSLLVNAGLLHRRLIKAGKWKLAIIFSSNIGGKGMQPKQQYVL